MGEKNKIVKLTSRKIKCIIRDKTNGFGTKSIVMYHKIDELVHARALATFEAAIEKARKLKPC